MTNLTKLDSINDAISRAKKELGKNQKGSTDSTIKVPKGVKWTLILLALFLLSLILFNLFTFKVTETQQAVVSKFGEIVRVVVDKKDPELVRQIQENPTLKNVKIIEGKGLFFKWPFIEQIELFTNKLVTYDTSAKEVVTKDKKRLIVDNYTQWRITNPALFKISVKTEANAQARLDDIIYSSVREQIGASLAHDLIANKEHATLITEKLTQNTNKNIHASGMEVVDVRIRRTDPPKENNESIYNRMRTERDKISKQYMAEGEEEYQKKTSAADRERTIIEAEAIAKSEKIKGEGDAEANRIYAETYSKDREFFEFMKALDSYRIAFKDKTKIVIDSNSPLAKYLFGK